MEEHTALRRMLPLVMGGAGFSYQLNANPEAAPIASILKSAFDSGVRTLDTSPYYDPSEQLLGAALQESIIKNAYSREDYCIMTKVGRVSATHLDYSPKWVRESIERSLTRFNTTYLDVVFAHDVELVSIEEALSAVHVLFGMRKAGRIRYVGISGYDIDVLSNIVELAPKLFGHTIDTVQTWAQLTLQNNRLETVGFAKFRRAGVKMVFCSSPLAVGLLRSQSVPIGRLGNWHPAPNGLRQQAQEAAAYVASCGQDLASLALRYAIRRAQRNSSPQMLVSTICGVSTKDQLDENIATAKIALGCQGFEHFQSETTLDDKKVGTQLTRIDEQVEISDAPLCEKVREILGPWVNYDFSKKHMAFDNRDQALNDSTVVTMATTMRAKL